MKLSCEIVGDLLPLYIDEVCSGESRAAVEAHLRSCPDCRALHRRMTGVVAEEPSHPTEEKNRFTHGMRKVRRRWRLSLAAVMLVLMLIPMQWNHARGQGLSYSNLGNVVCTWRFLDLLKEGDYGAAFDCLDHKAAWEERTTGTSSGACLPLWERPEGYVSMTVDGEVWYFSTDTASTGLVEAGGSASGDEALALWQSYFPEYTGEISYYYTASYQRCWLAPAGAVSLLEERGEIPSAETGEGVWRVYLEDDAGNGYWLGCQNYPLAEPGAATDVRALLSEVQWSLECLPEWLWEELMEERQEARSQAAKDGEDYDAWVRRCRETFILRMEEWEAAYGRVQRCQYRIVNRTGIGEDTAWEVQFDLWFGEEAKSHGGICLISREYGGLTRGLVLGGSYSSPGRSYIVNRFAGCLRSAALGQGGAADEEP